MKVVEQKSGRSAQSGRITKETMTVIRNSSFVILLLLCVSCKKEKTENSIVVTSVEVSPSTLTLEIEETSILTATVEPEDDDLTVAWSVTASKPEGVVKVNKKTGKVTALTEGTATVTATAGNKTANCKVTVTVSDPAEEGVVINGVTWATRNVNTPGTFAVAPEAAGKLYQWNRKIGWAATGEVTDWDSTIPTGTTWATANDPSPAGWRMPTEAELKTLLNAAKVSSVWITQNGVEGRKFTDKATSKTLFLPAVGNRDKDYGNLYDAGAYGFYCDSTVSEDGNATGLIFDSDLAINANLHKNEGYSVRSVKK